MRDGNLGATMKLRLGRNHIKFLEDIAGEKTKVAAEHGVEAQLGRAMKRGRYLCIDSDISLLLLLISTQSPPWARQPHNQRQ